MKKKVVIAGGGTGGHLYPGIALANALMRSDMDIEVTFAGTKRGIESRVLPRAGFKLKTILASGLLGKKGLSRWISWCKLPVGTAQSMCFLIRKRPNLVVGVGGYASAPMAFSAWLLRIPILIHEQNVFPGMANKWLGKIADRIAVSFEESKRFFPNHKVETTGNMISEELCRPREEFPVASKDPFNILIMGGSQGAHSINTVMIEALDHLGNRKNRICITHQTGEADYEATRLSYEVKGFSADVRPFIEDMPRHYRKASLVICRSGATTLAEITASGKVSILIPFPFATHNHQEHNARVIEAANAGELILDNEVSGKRLAESIAQAMDEPEEMKEMEENSYRIGNRDATEKVRQICVELMGDARRAAGNEKKPKGNYMLSCF